MIDEDLDVRHALMDAEKAVAALDDLLRHIALVVLALDFLQRSDLLLHLVGDVNEDRRELGEEVVENIGLPMKADPEDLGDMVGLAVVTRAEAAGQ